MRNVPKGEAGCGKRKKTNEIGDIYNLTFVRNNSHAQQMGFHGDETVFFMLDYYNFLKVRKLADDMDGYQALSGIDRNDYAAAAKKVMGIYTLLPENSTSKELCPFSVGRYEEGQTSDKPFLGIIQIYIIDLEWKVNSEERVVRLSEVRNKILDYRKRIDKELQKTLKEKADYQIFQTVTSDDFCVAVRTGKIQTIYEAAASLMKVENGNGKRLFFTYTNVGVECLYGYNSENNESSLPVLNINSDILKENEKVQFAVRFRMETKLLDEIKKLIQNPSENSHLEEVNGLFGRYDLVVQINMEEFTKIYKNLCKNKAGYTADDTEDMSQCSKLVKTVVDEMKSGTIKTVNIRVLMNVDEIQIDGSKGIKPWFDAHMFELIKQRSEKVMKLYRDFSERYKVKFLLSRFRYEDLESMLGRIMGSYENLAYELDTHINWYVFSQSLENLFQNMNRFMEDMEDVEGDKQDERVLNKFMNELQMFINAFEAYIKLLQGVNQHTIQAPQYDIVAPVDGQKFIIAYSEYINSIHKTYCEFAWNEMDSKDVNKEERRSAKAIIYPEATKKNVETVTVLQYNRKTKMERVEREPASILLCKIPMFEYFERVYDLIPLIEHEICHQMLVLNRTERNDFLIQTILQEVSMKICYYMQVESSQGKYGVTRSALSELFEQCMLEALRKGYREKHPNWGNYVSTYVPESVREYLADYFQKGSEQERFGRKALSGNQIVSKFYEVIVEICGNCDECMELLEKIQRFVDEEENINSSQCSALAADKAEGKEDTQEKQDITKQVYTLYERLLSEMDKKMSWAEKEQGWKYVLEDVKYDTELDAALMYCYKSLKRKWNKNAANRQKLKRYFEQIRSLQEIYIETVNYCAGRRAETTKLEKMLETFAESVKDEFYKEFLEGKKNCIYSPDKVQQVNYWELQCPEHAKQNYLNACRKIAFRNLEGVIERTTTRYRETCADVIMCRWLGFGGLGYLRMVITAWTRMEGYEEEMISGNLLRERLIIVLAVLLENSNEKGKEQLGNGISIVDASRLVDEVSEYAEAEIQYAWNKVLGSVEAQEESEKTAERRVRVNQFFDKYMESIQRAKEAVSRGEAIRWEGGLWDRVCRENTSMFQDDPFLRTQVQYEINLYRRVFWILDALSRIQSNRKIKIETYILEHMSRIYENSIRGTELHPVVEKVVEFYNNPKSESTTCHEKMKDMLLFVQDYYYYSRFKR